MSMWWCCCTGGDVIGTAFETDTAHPVGRPITKTYDATHWGYWYEGTGDPGTVISSPANIYMGQLTGSTLQEVNGYWRFGGLFFPSGTEIKSAQLEIITIAPASAGFCVTSPTSTPTSQTFNGLSCVFSKVCRLKFHAEDKDNATAYTKASEFDGATLTTASTSNTYNVASDASATGAWATSGSAATLSDVTSAVQEVVDRTGWSSGNYINLFGLENGSDRLVDPDPTVAYHTFMSWRDTTDIPQTAKLEITYVG